MPYIMSTQVLRMSKRYYPGRLAICYTRVSTVEQWKLGTSLEAQEERLNAYCRMAGLEVVELIREEGVSASIPSGKRLGGIGHVICLKLNRLLSTSRTRMMQRAGP